MNNKIKGTFNAVSQEIITNKELTFKIGKVLNRKIWMPNVPSFVLKFIYGELSDTILKGVKVSNEKIKSLNFKFKYEKVDEALRAIYS